MAPRASIVIITYNSAEQIGACLDALARLDGAASYEVLVLDNDSHDATLAVVRQHAPGAIVIAEAENWGFAGGVNRAVAQAQGAYVLLLNPDALPEPTWAAELLAVLEGGAGVVGSAVLEPGGAVQSFGTVIDRELLLSSHRTEAPGDAPFAVDAVHGAAMGFAKALWQELGGFDERFFPAYWEEVDFCERARLAGHSVLVAPGAVVRHAEASSTGKYSAQFYGYYLRNRLAYAAKWLPWATLWQEFRPAEHARLAGAPLLDRRVASAAYDLGVAAAAPGEHERATIRAWGEGLRTGSLPADSYTPLLALLAQAEPEAVHGEVAFTSSFGALAKFRTLWNNVATRWYVRPNFDQQTRYNLATYRALQTFLEAEAARGACRSLDVALLALRAGTADRVGEPPSAQ